MTIAEELGFDVVLRDGGAVEFDEGTVFAQAFGVHGPTNQFLACTGFAIDEDASVGGGHQFDLLAKSLHWDGVSSNCSLLELARELLVVLAHLASLHRVLENDEGTLERERLFEEVVGPKFGGAHGRFNGPVTTDDDDLRDVLAFHLANLGKGVETIAIGQPDVQQDNVVGSIA